MRPTEVTSGVISGMAVEQFSVDVPVKLGDSLSTRSPDIQVTHFVMWDAGRRTL